MGKLSTNKTKPARVVDDKDYDRGRQSGLRGDLVIVEDRSSEFLEGWLNGTFDRISRMA